jgi:hypothetical protein
MFPGRGGKLKVRHEVACPGRPWQPRGCSPSRLSLPVGGGIGFTPQNGNQTVVARVFHRAYLV